MDEMERLIEAEIPALRRYAYALVRDSEAADDLVQDCLERAISRWYLRRHDGNVRVWLFTILRNLHINAWHQRKRRGVPLALDQAPDPATPPEQSHGRELRDLLATLDQLGEDQKSLLLLVAVEDLSYEEAAKVLGIPLGTVMSRLSRARQRLRGLMQDGAILPLRRVK